MLGQILRILNNGLQYGLCLGPIRLVPAISETPSMLLISASLMREREYCLALTLYRCKLDFSQGVRSQTSYLLVELPATQIKLPAAPCWCKVMCNAAELWKRIKFMATLDRLPPKSSRASISFPSDLYAEIELLALQKKVSVAWVIRDAAERYVADEFKKIGNAVQARLL